jgi:hypothetical protein
MNIKGKFHLIFNKFIVLPFIYLRKFFDTPPTIHSIIIQDSKVTSANYVLKHLETALLFARKKELLIFIADNYNLEGCGFEFGVYKGENIKNLAKLFSNLEFYGFDSFVGLKENWAGTSFAKGSFTLNDKLPKVGNKINLIKGFFDQSLPLFLENFQKKISLIYFDADTYESTLYCLMQLKDKLESGTIIIFDEYLGYPNWQNGEYRAFSEFCETTNKNFKYIGFSENQCAVQLIN